MQNKVCKNSHSFIGTKCKQCIRDANKRSYEKHKEKIKEKRAKYREQNLEKLREMSRNSRAKHVEKRRHSEAKWYQENKHKKKETGLAWRQKNYDKFREKQKLWYKQNQEKYTAYCAKRRTMKIKATLPWLNKEHFNEISQFYKEAKKLQNLDGIKREVDHIIPLINKDVCGLHVPWNLQILTSYENNKKGNKL